MNLFFHFLTNLVVPKYKVHASLAGEFLEAIISEGFILIKVEIRLIGDDRVLTAKEGGRLAAMRTPEPERVLVEVTLFFVDELDSWTIWRLMFVMLNWLIWGEGSRFEALSIKLLRCLGNCGDS